VRARFKGDIHRKEGRREVFKAVASLHSYNLQQFAWWILERDRFRVPPMRASVDLFESRFFPKYYSIEGEAGPRPHPADIPFQRGEFVTIVAAYTDELGVTRRLDELGHVAFTYKASARSSRLYHVLFAEQNYYFATLYDHDLSGPKIEWVRPPSPGECWWRREIFSPSLKDELRYMKEPRQGFEVDHIVSIRAGLGQDRLPARVVHTWSTPSGRAYEVGLCALSCLAPAEPCFCQVCFPEGGPDLPRIYRRGELLGPCIEWELDDFKCALDSVCLGLLARSHVCSCRWPDEALLHEEEPQPDGPVYREPVEQEEEIEQAEEPPAEAEEQPAEVEEGMVEGPPPVGDDNFLLPLLELGAPAAGAAEAHAASFDFRQFMSL